MRQKKTSIYEWFRRFGEKVIQFRWLVLLVIIALTVFAFLGMRRITVDTSNESWFLDDDPLVVATEEFEEVFGNNDYVGILVEADDVFAPDILRMIRELGQELLEKVPYADDVVSLTDVDVTRGTAEGLEIADLVPDTIPSAPHAIETIRAQALSRPSLVNRLFADDSSQTWVMLRLETFPEEWEGSEPPEIQVGRTALEMIGQEKYQAYQLTASGWPVMGYERQMFFGPEGRRLVMLSFGIAILVLLLFLRTARGVIVPLVIFIIALFWVFGGMGWLGVELDNMAMTVPIILGLAMSIGYSIHFLNFFQRAFRSTGERRNSVINAVEETGWPIFFTAATTIGALCSFSVVPVKTVQWMGLTSAALVVAVYVLVMTLPAALLSFGKNREISAPDTSRVEGGLRQVLQRIDTWIEEQLGRFSHWVLDHQKVIMVVFIILVMAFLGGFKFITATADFERTLGLRLPFIQKLFYIGNSKIGSVYSYSVVLTFNEQDRGKDPDVLQKVDRLLTEIEKFPLTKRTSSLTDIIKDLNQVMHQDNPAYYRIPESRDLVSQLLLLYEMANGSEQGNWADYDYSTLRLLVELGVEEYSSVEVEREFHDVKQRVRELFPDATFGTVGSVVQFAVMANYIVKGEIFSFLIALTVIGILMILVFQNVKTGLIGMIPNVAPALVVGGLMGYLDIPLDMMTMMIIPTLLGLAVDDTIHFIVHSKHEFLRTGSYQISIRHTFRTVGKSIFMTSFILVAAFAVYRTSISLFFNNLGLLMGTGVLAALLADYFVTPVLVNWLQPFGKIEDELVSPSELAGIETQQ